MKQTLLLLLIPALLAACVAPPTISTAKIVPARVPDASRPRVLAVIPFDGDKDGVITAALEKTLEGISIDGHPYYTLVDRGKVGAALSAQQVSANPPTDAEAAAIGRATGATGVLVGTVKITYEERQPKEQRTVCLRAGEDGGCVRWGDTAVACRQRETVVTVAPRLIVTETGRISYAKGFRGKNSSTSCTDSTTPFAGREELITRAGEQIMKELRRDIAPYFVSVEATVMTTSEGIPSGEGRDLFIKGLVAAEENRPDRACPLWEKAERFAPAAPGLLFDLGICREMAGELEQALASYQKAEALLRNPDENVTGALDRVRKEIAGRSRMSGEGAR